MTLWPAAVVVLTLALIQPVKGAIVGLQWAMEMHGFNQAKQDRDALRDGLAEVAGPGGT